jgi:hypothetical protein
VSEYDCYRLRNLGRSRTKRPPIATRSLQSILQGDAVVVNGARPPLEWIQLLRAFSQAC